MKKMSKKIVIELSENLAEIIRWFLKAKCPFSSKEVVKQITQQLESKVERSVIEWHSPDDIPEDGENVIFVFGSGAIPIRSGVFMDNKVVSFSYAIPIHRVSAWARLSE